eukprot:m51a1_g693 putative protein phosphatase 2c (1016) ;mRNA; f:355518-358953
MEVGGRALTADLTGRALLHILSADTEIKRASLRVSGHRPVTIAGGGAARSGLYAMPGEVVRYAPGAAASKGRATFAWIGSDGATSSRIIVALRSPRTGCVVLGHFCGEIAAHSAGPSLVAGLSDDDRAGGVDAFLAGARTDAGPPSRRAVEAALESLARSLVASTPVRVRVACILSRHVPGICIDTATGDVRPARWLDRGPDTSLRIARSVVGAPAPVATYSREAGADNVFTVEAFDYASDDPKLRALSQMLDDGALLSALRLGTAAPGVEEPRAAEDVRSALRLMMRSPRETVFPGGNARVYRRTSAGTWDLAPQPVLPTITATAAKGAAQAAAEPAGVTAYTAVPEPVIPRKHSAHKRKQATVDVTATPTAPKTPEMPGDKEKRRHRRDAKSSIKDLLEHLPAAEPVRPAVRRVWDEIGSLKGSLVGFEIDRLAQLVPAQQQQQEAGAAHDDVTPEPETPIAEPKPKDSDLADLRNALAGLGSPAAPVASAADELMKSLAGCHKKAPSDLSTSLAILGESSPQSPHGRLEVMSPEGGEKKKQARRSLLVEQLKAGDVESPSASSSALEDLQRSLGDAAPPAARKMSNAASLAASLGLGGGPEDAGDDLLRALARPEAKARGRAGESDSPTPSDDLNDLRASLLGVSSPLMGGISSPECSSSPTPRPGESFKSLLAELVEGEEEGAGLAPLSLNLPSLDDLALAVGDDSKFSLGGAGVEEAMELLSDLGQAPAKPAGDGLIREFGEHEDINVPGLRRAKKKPTLTQGGSLYNMEDVHACKYPLLDENTAFFGVFDGFAGKEAALSASHLMPEEFMRKILSAAGGKLGEGDQRGLFEEVFLSVDDQLKDYECIGCTCSAVLIWRSGDARYLQVGNVGDSNAFLVRGKKAMMLTEEHKVTSQTERKRLEQMGIPVTQGMTRINGIAVSRALGCRFVKDMKQGIVASPSVSECIKLGPEDELVIIASDGIWDVLSGQQAYEMAQKEATAQAMARRILTTATANHKCVDNVTVVVVRL